MNEYAKMIVVLVVLSVISGTVLAYSYEITDVKMREQAEKALQESVRIVVPDTAKVETAEHDDMLIYEGMDDQGSKKGIAFKVESDGYGGTIEMMVGYDPKEGKLTGLEILSMQETPGLGAKITEPEFKDQFKGKSVEDDFEAEKDVQIISGATVSSKAVSKGLKEALDKVVEIYPVGGDY